MPHQPPLTDDAEDDFDTATDTLGPPREKISAGSISLALSAVTLALLVVGVAAVQRLSGDTRPPVIELTPSEKPSPKPIKPESSDTPIVLHAQPAPTGPLTGESSVAAPEAPPLQPRPIRVAQPPQPRRY